MLILFIYVKPAAPCFESVYKMIKQSVLVFVTRYVEMDSGKLRKNARQEAQDGFEWFRVTWNRLIPERGKVGKYYTLEQQGIHDLVGSLST